MQPVEHADLPVGYGFGDGTPDQLRQVTVEAVENLLQADRRSISTFPWVWMAFQH